MARYCSLVGDRILLIIIPSFWEGRGGEGRGGKGWGRVGRGGEWWGGVGWFVYTYIACNTLAMTWCISCITILIGTLHGHLVYEWCGTLMTPCV